MEKGIEVIDTKEKWSKLSSKDKKEVIHLAMEGVEDDPDTHNFDVESGACEKCSAKIWEGGSRLCSVIGFDEIDMYDYKGIKIN